MTSKNSTKAHYLRPFYAYTVGILCGLLSMQSFSAIEYSTPMEEVKWQTESSKFMCRLSHPIDGFGEAIFEREAGESTRFYLNSKTPRMKTGKAALVIEPPAWSAQASSSATLSLVAVKESMTPVSLGRQLSERMLAELEKGMLLAFNRQPWYGDTKSIKVTVSSVGFRMGYQKYLSCLSNLLPVNFGQVERSVFYYGTDDDELSKDVKRRLDVVVDYIKSDPAIQSFYLDGHTDSEGIRNENLLKSQRRTERVMDYLIEKQIPREQIIARWHGERYPVATNRTAAGRAKNRRVTLRLSKEPPQTLVESAQPDPEKTPVTTEN